MAILIAQNMSETVQLQPTYQLCDAAGDTVLSGAGTFVTFLNVGGTTTTVTVVDQHSVGPAGATSFDPTITATIDADEILMIGPLDDRFSGADGYVSIFYDTLSVTLTVAAITLS